MLACFCTQYARVETINSLACLSDSTIRSIIGRVRFTKNGKALVENHDAFSKRRKMYWSRHLEVTTTPQSDRKGAVHVEKVTTTNYLQPTLLTECTAAALALLAFGKLGKYFV